MPTVNRYFEQLKMFWGGLGPKQRVLLMGGGAVTLAVLLVFVRLIGNPEYKPLFTNLEAADAQSLAQQLTTKNIPYQLSTDGKTISVPANQVDAARLEVASAGMPRSGRLGFELFDKVSWGQTEFDEKVNYQRALEGELERTVQTLRNVESARVHLVLPADSVFIGRERAAKASVILKLRRGNISDETQMAIARLVSGAVDKLAPENVLVIDADTNRRLGRMRGDSATGDLEQQLTQKLLATLEPVAGPQKVRASVNVEYDPTSAEESVEKYDPHSVVALTMQRTEEQIGNGTGLAAGIPGASSNVPGASGSKPAAGSGGNVSDTQMSKSENGTYVVNKTIRRVMEPAGRIRRISAALLVDDAVENSARRKRTPEELKQLEDLAKAAIGLDEKRGDAVTVSNMSFEVEKVPVPPPPKGLEKVRGILNDWSVVVRYASLLLLFLLAYFLVLRPIQRQTLKTLRELPSRPQRSVAANTQAKVEEAVAAMQVEAADQPVTVMKKAITEKVRQEPSATSRLVEAWLHEEA